MLAEHLLGAIAVQLLGAAVPAHDVARGVEHVDRVILHALNQEPEALLALPQPLVRGTALGQITHDHGVADEVRVGVAQGRDHTVGPEAPAILTHTPALLLDMTLALRDSQRALETAAPTVLARADAVLTVRAVLHKTPPPPPPHRATP